MVFEGVDGVANPSLVAEQAACAVIGGPGFGATRAGKMVVEASGDHGPTAVAPRGGDGKGGSAAVPAEAVLALGVDAAATGTASAWEEKVEDSGQHGGDVACLRGEVKGRGRKMSFCV